MQLTEASEEVDVDFQYRHLKMKFDNGLVLPYVGVQRHCIEIFISAAAASEVVFLAQWAKIVCD
jgi:hypothetical protein